MGLIVNIAARRLAKADINPERCITMIFYATLHHHCALPDRAHKIQVNTTSSRNISDFIMRAFRLPAFLLFPETQRDTRFERSAERERESRGGDLRTRFHPRTRATDYASWDETSSLAVRLSRRFGNSGMLLKKNRKWIYLRNWNRSENCNTY